MSGKDRPAGKTIDYSQDRYPSLVQVLRRIAQESEVADGPVEKLEVHLFASGEATYRCWAPKAEEASGGHLGEVDSG